MWSISYILCIIFYRIILQIYIHNIYTNNLPLLYYTFKFKLLNLFYILYCSIDFSDASRVEYVRVVSRRFNSKIINKISYHAMTNFYYR